MTEGPGYDAGGAAVYDTDPEHQLAAGEARWWQDTLTRLGTKDDAAILEVGAGTGLLMGALIAAGYKVTGLEPSAAMIEQARRGDPALRAAPFIHAKAGKSAPIKNQSFDAVLMRQVLCHISDVQPVFDACFAWLRPGGAFVIVDGVWPSLPCPEPAFLQTSLIAAGFEQVEAGPADALTAIRQRSFPNSTPRYQAFGRRPGKGGNP